MFRWRIAALLLGFVLIYQLVDGELKVPVAGIFQSDSASENAFSYAVYLYNQRSDRKFFIDSKISMPKYIDSTTVRRKICEHVENRSVVAIFGGDLGNIIQDVKDITATIEIPFFTSETVPMEPVNITEYLITSSTTPISSGWLDDSTAGGGTGVEGAGLSGSRTGVSGPALQSESLQKYGQYDQSRPRELVARQLQPSFVVQLRPPVIEALANLIIVYKWQNFSYVCNTGEGLLRMQHIIETLHKQLDYVELNIDIRYIPDPQVAAKDLRHLDYYLRVQKDKHILIDFDSQTNLEIFMKKIVLMGMNRREYHYIVSGLGLDEMALEEFKFSGVNVTGLQILDPNRAAVKQFYAGWQHWNTIPRAPSRGGTNFKAALMMDAVNTFVNIIDKLLQTPSTRDELNKYITGAPVKCYIKRGQNRRLYGYTNRRYQIRPFSLGKRFIKTLLSEQEVGLTGPIVFTPSGTRTNVSMRILSVVENKGIEFIGNYVQSTGLNLTNFIFDQNKQKEEQTRNRTLRVVTIVSPPFTYYSEFKKDNTRIYGNERFEGFAMSMLAKVAQLVNFNYEIHLVHDNKFGGMDTIDGKKVWNGMIGEILNDTADIVIAPITISLARAKVIKFSEPFLTFGLSVMIKKPGVKKPGIFSFLQPLNYSTWSCILAACVVVSCGLYLVARISPFEWSISQDPEGVKRVERDFTFMNSLWFSFAAFVQQGVDIAPRSPGARILSSAWWFFTLIMIAYYTANLAAFLTVARMVTPINDWNDLVRPNMGIEYGPVNSGSTKNFFYNTKLQPFKQMGDFMRKNTHVFSDTVENGVARVRKSKGKYAFILESRMNEYHNNREPCDTMMVGTPFGDKGYGVATPMDFPLSEAINDAILTLRETQDLAQLRKTWWIEKGQCMDNGQKSISDALALINVAGVFYILTAGLTLALFTSLFEFYYNARKEYHKHNSSFSDFLRQKARVSIHGPLAEHRMRSRNLAPDNYAVPPPARTINLI